MQKGAALATPHELWPVTGLKRRTLREGVGQSEGCLATFTTISMPYTKTEISLDIGSPSFRYVSDMTNVAQISSNARVSARANFTLLVAAKCFSRDSFDESLAGMGSRRKCCDAKCDRTRRQISVILAVREWKIKSLLPILHEQSSKICHSLAGQKNSRNRSERRMCRWAAYRGEPLYLEELVSDRKSVV